jgi:hypothetical protein
MTEYNPTVIQNFADRLYRKSSLVILLTTCKFVLAVYIGWFVVQSVPSLSGFRESSILYISLGLAFVVGLLVGQYKALDLQCQAQVLLAQMHTELNTRAIRLIYSSIQDNAKAQVASAQR